MGVGADECTGAVRPTTATHRPLWVPGLPSSLCAAREEASARCVARCVARFAPSPSKAALHHPSGRELAAWPFAGAGGALECAFGSGRSSSSSPSMSSRGGGSATRSRARRAPIRRAVIGPMPGSASRSRNTRPAPFDQRALANSSARCSPTPGKRRSSRGPARSRSHGSGSDGTADPGTRDPRSGSPRDTQANSAVRSSVCSGVCSASRSRALASCAPTTASPPSNTKAHAGSRREPIGAGCESASIEAACRPDAASPLPFRPAPSERSRPVDFTLRRPDRRRNVAREVQKKRTSSTRRGCCSTRFARRDSQASSRKAAISS
jgi:hypothetical protein